MKTGPAAFTLGLFALAILIVFVIFVSWPLAAHWTDVVLAYWGTMP